MSANPSPIKKDKPRIEYPQIQPQILVDPPRPLPFSLRNQSIIESMSLLGISANDVNARPFQEFLKEEKNKQRAINAYNRHLSNRDELIKQIQDVRKQIDDKGQLKISQDVIYEKRLHERDEQMIQSNNQMNKQVLKSIALNQLRQAYKIERGEQKINYQKQISQKFDDQLTQKMQEAKDIVQSRDFTPVRREVCTDQCLHMTKNQPVRNEEEDLQRYQFVTQQKIQRIKENPQILSQKVSDAQKRHEDLSHDNISKKQRRLDKNETVLSSIPIKAQQRKEQLMQKAAFRTEKTKEVQQRNVNFTIEKISNVTKLLQTEEDNFQKTMKSNQISTNQKIQREAEILQNRNIAASRIFEKQKEDLENYKRHLDQRDLTIQQNIDQLFTEKLEKLNNARIELQNHTAQIRRSQRARDCMTAMNFRRKVVQSTDGLVELKKQRARSQLAKVKAKAVFLDQKNAAMSLLPKVVTTDDNSKVAILVQTLGITEIEARQLIEQAKQPSSQHSNYC